MPELKHQLYRYLILWLILHTSQNTLWQPGDNFENILRGYITDNFGYCPRLVIVHHHDAHAASAFWGSGFDEAMVLTMDASGDSVSTQLSIGRKDKIETIKRYSRPNSLGIFYSIITQFCGFRRDSDEYKLMGMAAYGNPDAYDFSEILNFRNGDLFFDESFLKPIKKPALFLHCFSVGDYLFGKGCRLPE